MGGTGACRRRQRGGRLGARGAAFINLLAFGVPDSGRDVLSAARLGEIDRRDRRRPAARPCRHDPQAGRASRTPPSQAYVRGQALVCIALGSIYAIGLSLVGLQFGLIIGLIAGAISFIPFVGTFVGAVMALGMALAQFPPDWWGVGQGRRRIPVRPVDGRQRAVAQSWSATGSGASVWIMFALLAGGSLFGFVGILIAVPTAAVIGVIVRHLLAAIARAASSRRRSGLRRRWQTSLPSTWRCRRRTYAREDFVTASGNREALAWIDRWPDWRRPRWRWAARRLRQDPSRPHLGGAGGRDLDRRLPRSRARASPICRTLPPPRPRS